MPRLLTVPGTCAITSVGPCSEKEWQDFAFRGHATVGPPATPHPGRIQPDRPGPDEMDGGISGGPDAAVKRKDGMTETVNGGSLRRLAEFHPQAPLCQHLGAALSWSRVAQGDKDWNVPHYGCAPAARHGATAPLLQSPFGAPFWPSVRSGAARPLCCPPFRRWGASLALPASDLSGRRRRTRRCWPPSAAQTARAVFPHAAFTKTQH